MAVAAMKPDLQPTVFSVEVAPEYVEALERLNAGTGQSIEHLLAGIIAEYCHQYDMGGPLEASAEEMDAVRRGIEQADRGEVISQGDLMARIKAKYGW